MPIDMNAEHASLAERMAADLVSSGIDVRNDAEVALWLLQDYEAADIYEHMTEAMNLAFQFMRAWL